MEALEGMRASHSPYALPFALRDLVSAFGMIKAWKVRNSIVWSALSLRQMAWEWEAAFLLSFLRQRSFALSQASTSSL